MTKSKCNKDGTTETKTAWYFIGALNGGNRYEREFETIKEAEAEADRLKNQRHISINGDGIWKRTRVIRMTAEHVVLSITDKTELVKCFRPD